MKLNYDCLRQTLIALEEHLSISDDYSFQHEGIHQISDYPELSSFDKKEIAYCVYMLADSGMIAIIEPTDIIREIRVETLTYKGHEFIEQIKSDSIWKKVKDKLKPVGAFTLNIISQTALKIINESIINGI